MKRALRILAWTGGIILVLVALVTVAAFLFPWNWLRGPLDRRISDALGRGVAVDGPLSVHLGETLRIVADDVRIANTPWGSQPNMVQMKRFVIAIYLPALLKGRTVLPLLQLDEPDFDLEKNAKGEANWRFANPEAKAIKAATVPKKRTQVPIIEHLVVQHGRLTYKDPTNKIDFSSQVSTALGVAPEHQQLRLEGHGTFAAEPFHLTIDGGSILALRNKSQPYPVRIEARIGQTDGGVDGTVTQPLQLAGFDLAMHLAGNDMAEVFPIFGIPLPHTAPYSLQGRLAKQGNTWSFHDFAGRVGGSDLSGNVSLTQSKPRSKLTATVRSRTLDVKDLSGLLGIKPGHEQEATPPGRVLPNVPFNLDKLRAMDMDIHFTGERVLAPHLPMSDLKVAMKIDDGLAHIDLLSLDLARGDVAGSITLDGRKPQPTAEFRLKLSQIKLHDFLKATPFANETAGTMAGRVDLTGSGDSTAEIIGHSSGRLSIFMAGGSISDLIVRLIGLDVSKALGLIATKDKPVGVRCLVTDLDVHDGLATVSPMVLDTTVSDVTGKGRLNLADETLHLQLAGHPKQPSLFKVHSDVLVGGSFKHPSVGLNPAELGAQGAAAAALGALLTPFAAVLPFIDLGLGKNSPCRQLIEQAKTGSPPSSPPNQPD